MLKQVEDWLHSIQMRTIGATITIKEFNRLMEELDKNPPTDGIDVKVHKEWIPVSPYNTAEFKIQKSDKAYSGLSPKDALYKPFSIFEWVVIKDVYGYHGTHRVLPERGKEKHIIRFNWCWEHIGEDYIGCVEFSYVTENLLSSIGNYPILK